MPLSRTQKRNRKNKTERRKKASEARRRQSSASRKIQTAVRDYNKLDKCAICLLAVKPNLQKQCHNFHPKCIAQWIASTNANKHLCPSCRQPLLPATSNSPKTSNPSARRRQPIDSARRRQPIDSANEVSDLFMRINILVNEIDDIDYDFLSQTENERLNGRIQRVLTMFNTFIDGINRGDMNDPSVVFFLEDRAAIFGEANDLIRQLQVIYEQSEETADIRATR